MEQLIEDHPFSLPQILSMKGYDRTANMPMHGHVAIQLMARPVQHCANDPTIRCIQRKTRRTDGHMEHFFVH